MLILSVSEFCPAIHYIALKIFFNIQAIANGQDYTITINRRTEMDYPKPGFRMFQLSFPCLLLHGSGYIGTYPRS